MSLANNLWNAMGWCPMHAAVGFSREDKTKGCTEKNPAADDGPAARRSSRNMRLAWGVLILMWVLAFLALPYLPEIIPIHWGLHGEANGFADRFTGMLGLPAFASLIMILLIILPRYDTIQYSLDAFRDTYALVILTVMALFLSIEAMTIAISLGVGIPVVTIMPILMGLLFIVMGGLMPQIGRNRTMGIRLPWTLASDEIWRQTHEHGGNVFMAAGILVVIGSLLAGIWALALMLVIILGATVYICIWSYRLAKKSHVPGG